MNVDASGVASCVPEISCFSNKHENPPPIQTQLRTGAGGRLTAKLTARNNKECLQLCALVGIDRASKGLGSSQQFHGVQVLARCLEYPAR